MNQKQVDGIDLRKFLYVYYITFGVPAGTLCELKQSKDGKYYPNLKSIPLPHMGAAKSVIVEIRRIMGCAPLQGDFWPFVQQVVAECKKRGCRGIYDVRDRFPNVFKELGGLGQFRLPKICNAKVLKYIPEDRDIRNDGCYANIVRHMSNQEMVVDTITGEEYSIHNLLVIE